MFPGDLKLGGIKNPELIAKSSLQDRDSVFNFMAAVTVSTSLAVRWAAATMRHFSFPAPPPT